MCKRLISSCFVSLCLLVAGSTAAAQEVVHALTGTVVNVNPQSKSMVVNTDDGSSGQFALADPNSRLDFNRAVKDEVKPAANFDKTNEQVIVLYYGDSTVRTAVGVQDLGAGPFVKTQGTVVKTNKHDHTITLKDGSGKTVTIHMAPNSLADTTDGVMPGERFEPSKGDTVNVVATNQNGVEQGLFLHD